MSKRKMWDAEMICRKTEKGFDKKMKILLRQKINRAFESIGYEEKK